MRIPRYFLTAFVCASAVAQDLDSLEHLGDAYAEQGKRAQAIETYNQAVAVARETLGPTHLRTLTNMNLLGTMRLMVGDIAGAEPLLREVADTARKLYPNDIQLAAALGGLSCIISRRDEFAEAQQVADEALAISLRAEGEDSLNTGMLYANAGEIHRLAGHNERALPLYRKARAIWEKKVGPVHPRVAAILSQEGLILMEDNQLALADRAMASALDILHKSCPGCATETWIAESNLALLRLKQKRYSDADRLLTDVLALQEKSVAHPGKETALTLQSLAAVREKERKHNDAVTLKQRADRLLSASFR